MDGLSAAVARPATPAGGIYQTGTQVATQIWSRLTQLADRVGAIATPLIQQAAQLISAYPLTSVAVSLVAGAAVAIVLGVLLDRKPPAAPKDHSDKAVANGAPELDPSSSEESQASTTPPLTARTRGDSPASDALDEGGGVGDSRRRGDDSVTSQRYPTTASDDGAGGAEPVSPTRVATPPAAEETARSEDGGGAAGAEPVSPTRVATPPARASLEELDSASDGNARITFGSPDHAEEPAVGAESPGSAAGSTDTPLADAETVE